MAHSMQRQLWLWWIMGLALAACIVTHRVEPYGPPQDAGAAVTFGHIAKIGEFPFIANIYLNNAPHGTGFLISPTQVMTAAHVASAGTRLAVRIGGIRRDGRDGDLHFVKSRAYGPYATTKLTGDDYAILNLELPSYRRPVRVNGLNANMALKENMDVTLVGFGDKAQDHEPDTYPTYLQKASQKILKVNRGFVSIKQSLTMPDIKNGDSGGPLLTRNASGEWVAIGISSNGSWTDLTSNFCRTDHAISQLLTSQLMPLFLHVDLKTCAFTGRRLEGGKWKCPVTHPWDAGVVDQPDMPAWKGKQCSGSAHCASTLNLYYRALGKPVNPARHRNA